MTIADRLQSYRDITGNPVNAGRKWGALADYLRWNIGHRLMGTEYVLRMANDARIILSDRQNYATLAYTCGAWDFADMLFVMHVLRPGDLFVDVGANVGGYSILAAKVSGAHALAFEPIPVTYGELRRNVRLNDIDGLVETHRCGLGDAESTLQMTAQRGGLNHITVGPGGEDVVPVAIRRLDDVVAGRACRLLKLDAEGYELSILRGASETLGCPRLAGIIVELNGSGARYGYSDQSVHDEIVGYGFEPHGYCPAARRLTPLRSFNTDSFNTIYVRDAAALAPLLQAAPKVEVRGRRF